MDIVVRKIELEDAPGFWSALSSVAQERTYILTIEPPPFERSEAFVRENVEENHAQYVALHDGKVVGWADILPLKHPKMTHVGALGMGILKDYRGRGIGGQLLERTIEHALASGLKRLELEVFADNEPAIRLYKKHGYVQEGLKRYARSIDGQYQDIVVMAQYRI